MSSSAQYASGLYHLELMGLSQARKHGLEGQSARASLRRTRANVVPQVAPGSAGERARHAAAGLGMGPTMETLAPCISQKPRVASNRRSNRRIPLSKSEAVSAPAWMLMREAPSKPVVLASHPSVRPKPHFRSAVTSRASPSRSDGSHCNDPERLPGAPRVRADIRHG